MRGWVRTETALRHRRPLPSNPVNALVALGVGLVALALVLSSLTNSS